jgi:hypothetical protein
MSNSGGNDTISEKQRDEQELHLAEHFGHFIEDHADQSIDEEKEDELIRKLESDPDYMEERNLIERATAYEENDAKNPVVYSVEHESFSLRGDLFLLSGITTFVGLRFGRYMWYKRGAAQQQSNLTRPVLDTILSCLVGTAASVESLQSDDIVVRQSIADVPLVSGRSMVSDELCKPLIQEYERYKTQEALRHPRSVELKTLKRFISNCRHRHELEAKLRKERGLSVDSPVFIPPPGVPIDHESEHDDDTVENPAATREETAMKDGTNTAAEKRPPPSSSLPDNYEQARSTATTKKQEHNSSTSSFYHAFMDSYWWTFGQAFETIEDFELRMRLNAIHRKRRKLVATGKQATRTQQQDLQDEEITARLNHAYHVMRRKALQPDRLYPTESFVLYGPSYNLRFIGESLTAGTIYYALWRHGPRMFSLILSIVSKRYRAAPTYTDSIDYKRFGRIHAVGVAWLWYLVPTLQKEEETFPTIPLVEGRSHVADEMCDDFVNFFEKLHAKETCERRSNDNLKQIYTFVRNCQRRRAYETKLRKERGLKDDQAVAIPVPGVPTDYSIVTASDEDWAKGMVADQGTDRSLNNKKQ